ncbi:MAG: type 4a pilus biogenesis protein PilO [bacterium]|nr:type 4a pilus biogenesis protein PilO [bacterium]
MDKIGYRERIIIAAAVIVLIAAGWYFLFYSSQKDSISAKQIEITRLQNEIITSTVAPGTIDTLKKKIERLEEEARNSGTKLVSKDQLVEIKDYISDKIKEHNLEYDSIEPDMIAWSSSAQDSMNIGIKKVPITIFIAGEFFAIGKFLEELPDYPFLIRAVDLNVDTDDDVYPELHVRLIVHVFFKEDQ